MISYVSVEPVATASGYTKNKKNKVEIPCSNIEKSIFHFTLQNSINRHMVGVDLLDMLVSLYRTRLKTRSCYLPIFAQIIDLCLNISWLLYRRHNMLMCEETRGNGEEISLKYFRYNVSKSLSTKRRSSDARIVGNLNER